MCWNCLDWLAWKQIFLHVKLRATEGQAALELREHFDDARPPHFMYTNAILPKRYWIWCKLLADKWNSIKNNKLLKAVQANSRKSTSEIIKYSKGFYSIYVCVRYRLRIFNAQETTYSSAVSQNGAMPMDFSIEENKVAWVARYNVKNSYITAQLWNRSIEHETYNLQSFIHSCFERRLQWLSFFFNWTASSIELFRQCKNLIDA